MGLVVHPPSNGRANVANPDQVCEDHRLLEAPNRAIRQ